jgi:hypothetical protein
VVVVINEHLKGLLGLTRFSAISGHGHPLFRDARAEPGKPRLDSLATTFSSPSGSGT